MSYTDSLIIVYCCLSALLHLLKVGILNVVILAALRLLTACTCVRITLESCTSACSRTGICILRTSLCTTLIHLGTGCLPCCVEAVDGKIGRASCRERV